MASRLRSKLAEQISELSNPKPASFHPDEDFLGDETAAKVCDFTYEAGQLPPVRSVILSWARKGIELDDPKYAGKVVSRKELDERSLDSESELTSDPSDLEEETLQTVLQRHLENDHMTSDEGGDAAEISGEDNGRDEESDDDLVPREEEYSGEECGGEEFEEMMKRPARGTEKQRQEGAAVSLFAVNNDVEKGKAAREQIRLLDKLLELRIKFQGILALSNRLPSPENMPFFLEEGGPSLKEALNQAHRNVQGLLWTLLGLQETFLSDIDDADRLSNELGRRGEDASGSSDDEEISSEDEKGKKEELPSNLPRKSRKRKRSSDSISEGDCEAEIELLHSRLRPYRDAVISKWNEKTRLATGKITSKAYMEVDRSILSQIDHVMAGKERLVKRTQLKRSVYHILGEKEEKKEEDGSDPSLQRDAHLHDYNEDIFDDDDFYHQLLKELIDRKTSYSESADPIEMGRQWLELQKMRTKAKKKVDTKASKGRKLRYDVHPKLVNLMAPIEGGTFSDESKNDLFSSLFGSRYIHRT